MLWKVYQRKKALMSRPGIVFNRLRLLAAALMRATGRTAGEVSFRERPGSERDDETCSFDCIVSMLPGSYIVQASRGVGGRKAKRRRTRRRCGRPLRPAVDFFCFEG